MPRVSVDCRQMAHNGGVFSHGLYHPVHKYLWIVHDHDECIHCGNRRYINVYRQLYRKFKNRSRRS